MTRVFVYCFAFWSGALMLIHQVLWARSFRPLFGSSAGAASAVVLPMLAGLALGNLLGARLSRRSDPLRVFGGSQVLVGLFALLVRVWLVVCGIVWPHLYGWTGGNPVALRVAQAVLVSLAVVPATVAMGVALPLLVSALGRPTPRCVDPSQEGTGTSCVDCRTAGPLPGGEGKGWVSEDSGIHAPAVLYALQMAGAAAGAVLAGCFLPVWVGLRSSAFLAAAISLLIGVAGVFVGRTAPSCEREVEGRAPGEASPAPSRPSTGLLMAAMALGVGGLALYIVSSRLFSFISQGTVFDTRLLLVLSLLCLALGSAVVAIWGRRSDPWRLLGGTQLGAAAAILVAPILLSWIPLFTVSSTRNVSLAVHSLKLALGTAVALGPAMLLVGTVLPTMWQITLPSAAPRGARRVGVLSAVALLAGVVGSVLASYVFLPWLSAERAVLVVAAVFALLAVGGFCKGHEGAARWVGCAACLLLLIGWYALGAWRVRFQPRAGGETLLTYRDGPTASVAVLRQPGGHLSLVVDRTRPLLSTANIEHEIRQGRLPLLLHPNPQRVALIGVRGGMAARGVLDFSVERVVAVERIPELAGALPHLKAWNRAVFSDPRAELVVEPARSWLSSTTGQFDVIIGVQANPIQAGASDLLTAEHFRAARRRVAVGGLFAQWLPACQLTVNQLRTVTAAFLGVFPDAVLWQDGSDAEYPLLCLAGYRDGLHIDPMAVESACHRLAALEELPELMLSSPAGLVMSYVCGGSALREWADGAAANTDDRPVLEYTAPRTALLSSRKLAAATHELLLSFRPRKWCYAVALTQEPAADELFRAADLLRSAHLAVLRNNFEQEFRHLSELVNLAGNVQGVAMHVVRVAARYRARHMHDRSEALLSALVRHGEPPVAALTALAEIRETDGEDAESAALLVRAVALAPGRPAIRRSLVAILKRSERFAEAETHLRNLLQAEPDDPYLRLDLAHVLHRQDRTEEAAREVQEFKARWDGEDGRKVWQYLRRQGLGKYVDRPGQKRE